MNTQDIINQIRAIATAEDMHRVDQLIRSQPGPMAPEVQQALLEKLKESTAQSKAAREDMITTLKSQGVEYPLTDWLTPKKYADRFGLKNSEVVLNWINRGIIPPDHIKEIPELGVRLVKAVEYSPRTYERTTDKTAS
ncbi:hypothetical protein [Spirosoma sordidisoli]|uniref:Uncharacterized protein n=1 Tax=Spirosoma sordidisoli TaxID=2502893 RepID=A0A4V1RWC0_9BACT|nr:hypothetical protein [Spirosoma sordidisoli]RYC69738.1 hypothetical protein EQG79_14175 [Spirosoma sordidisoli]